MEELPKESLEKLARNLQAIRDRIGAAAARAGRPDGAVRLVAVTKSVSPQVAAALVALGVSDLGENRPEQAIQKVLALEGMGGEGPSVRWHMIGHYQRRKVRDTLRIFSLVHSVQSEDLLFAIARRAQELGVVQPVLLQVNVTGEGTKQGFAPDALGPAFEDSRSKGWVRVDGLMTMAPWDLPAPDLHRTFARLREIRDTLRTPERPLPELSMGMSSDFEVAVEEGATLVRVGSALFEGVLSS